MPNKVNEMPREARPKKPNKKKPSKTEISYPTHTVKHNLVFAKRYKIREGSAERYNLLIDGNNPFEFNLLLQEDNGSRRGVQKEEKARTQNVQVSCQEDYLPEKRGEL